MAFAFAPQFIQFGALSRWQKKHVIYGGTLNPPHLGHREVVVNVRDQFKTGHITVIPVGDAPHKDNRRLMPFEDRFAMTQLVFQNEPGVEVSDIESTLPKPTVTVTTLRTLFPNFDKRYNTAKKKIPFIIGVDALKQIATWDDAMALVKNLVFLVAPRNGDPVPRTAEINGKTVPLTIEEIDMEDTQISSTEIRNLVKAGATQAELEALVGKACAQYIQDHGLYQT